MVDIPFNISEFHEYIKCDLYNSKLRIYAVLKFMKYFNMKERPVPLGREYNKSQLSGFNTL